MNDLFSAQSQLEPIDIPDGELYYIRQLPIKYEVEKMLSALIKQTPWRAEQIQLFGNSMLQPRLCAWVAAPEVRYSYSNLQLKNIPWTPMLIDIKAAIEACTRHRFNSVLLNYYRDQNDSMGMHSDDEPELGSQPIIASYSLGQERQFILKHKFRKDLARVSLKLSSGSLLLMKGDTQRNWAHGINKSVQTCGARLNLTFRTIYSK